MNAKELAEYIVKEAGGRENITNAVNCMTRVRLNVSDPSKVKDDALRAHPDVISVIHDEPGYVQVVVGPGKAAEVLSEMHIAAKDKEAPKAASSGFLSRLRIFSDIFTPMIPAFMAAGLSSGIAGLISICVQASLLPDNTVTEVIRNVFVLISNGFLGYLAVFTGMQSARQFGADPMLGGLLGGASLSAVVDTISRMLGWYQPSLPNESILFAGSGGILGVIFGVWILSKAEKFLHARLKGVWDTLFTPLLTMTAVMPVYLFLVMPASGWLSLRIASFLSLFLNSENVIVSALTGYIAAALFLPMVMIGLHRGLLPIYILQIEKMGATTLFPTVAMAGAGQVGAALALYWKARKKGNRRLMDIIKGAVPAGFMGIGEPLIYGVTLPLAKPFVTAGLGAGFGGAWCMIRHVMSTAYSVSGIPAVTIMAPQCMLDYLIGLCISYAMGFVITWVFIPAEITQENEKETA